jgi:hypothetical protein
VEYVLSAVLGIVLFVGVLAWRAQAGISVEPAPVQEQIVQQMTEQTALLARLVEVVERWDAEAKAGKEEAARFWGEGKQGGGLKELPTQLK